MPISGISFTYNNTSGVMDVNDFGEISKSKNGHSCQQWNNEQGNFPRKHVRFADAEGFDLFQVRQLPVGSEETPPDMTLVLDRMNSRSHLGDNDTTARGSELTFTFDFEQPVSNFTGFMRTVESRNVCLESAVVRDGKLIGLIKVKNLAFHKTVFARITSDNWKTFRNIEAHYVKNVSYFSAGASPTRQVMDTFSFEYDLSNMCDGYTVQFAICFRCQGSEFWDNNSQRNYRILVHNPRISSATVSQDVSRASRLGKHPNFAGGININWSEFAIWHHLEDDVAPYW